MSIQWKLIKIAATGVFMIGHQSLALAEADVADPYAKVPGVIITHSPASSGCYIGSPSIAILPNGDYVASHDYFGPKSNYRERATSRVFVSHDRGVTWRHQSDIKGQLWATLFVHRDALYILGTYARYGNIVIHRSLDSGKTWTEPVDGNSGLLREGYYHCAPMPVISHNGRIWRAMESVPNGQGWAGSYKSMVMSVPVDADLLRASNWLLSAGLACENTWLGKKFGGWLEGNVVVAPDGSLKNMLRVEYPEGGGKAAIVDIQADGKTSSFNPETGFIELPGGSTKFTVRFDPNTKFYWTISNYIPERHAGQRPTLIRNTMALARSADLRAWEVRSIIAYHHDTRRHGFNYPDWVFDGTDIVAVSRTAHNDDEGGANSYHDANYLTFHRLADYRNLNNLELPPMPPPVKIKVECTDFLAEGYDFEVADFKNEVKAFSNRSYVWKDVPEKFMNWKFTRTEGGHAPKINVIAKRDTRLHFATLAKKDKLDNGGWEIVPDTAFWYTSGNKTQMRVYFKEVKVGHKITVPQGNWSGGVLLIPNAP